MTAAPVEHMAAETAAARAAQAGAARAAEAAAARPADRPDWWLAVKRGVARRCPNCGRGRLFRGYLTPVAVCPVCAVPLAPYRADDGAIYVTLFIACHVLVGLMVLVERSLAPALWVYALTFTPLALAVILGLLPFAKGGVIGVQYALDIKSDERS